MKDSDGFEFNECDHDGFNRVFHPRTREPERMETAGDLIERMEREAGCRVDDNDGNNLAVAGLMGAMARLMGKTAHTDYANDPKMDIPVGMYIQATNTPEHRAREAAGRAMAEMLCAGMPMEAVEALAGVRRH
jgi:hypothetical protein